MCTSYVGEEEEIIPCNSHYLNQQKMLDNSLSDKTLFNQQIQT